MDPGGIGNGRLKTIARKLVRPATLRTVVAAVRLFFTWIRRFPAYTCCQKDDIDFTRLFEF